MPRADTAGRLGDDATAAATLARAAALPLTAQERETAHDDLERLRELRD